MDTHRCYLNEAALLSIQRYAHINEEFTDMVTIHTTFVCFIAMGTYQNCFSGAALLSIQIYPYIYQEFISMVTIHITGVFFIPMDTHQRCLNVAALLSIQRCTHIKEEFTDDNYSHDSCLFHTNGYSPVLPQCGCCAKYPKICPWKWRIDSFYSYYSCLFRTPGYPPDSSQWGSSTEYQKIYLDYWRIYRRSYSQDSCLIPIAMQGTYKNCLSEAALLSIRKYTYITEEFIEMITVVAYFCHEIAR